MRYIKQILFFLLPEKYYLILLHKFFFILYDLQILRFFKAYKYHYWVKSFIRPGSVIIDIGANLGHYTLLFLRWTWSKGHVYAVEPVVPFVNILSRFCTRKNITIFPYAIGEESKAVTLGIPKSYSYLRTGIPEIIPEWDTHKNFWYTFSARMLPASDIFANLSHCDYIKVDVEGYEIQVLQSISFLLERFHPILQVEVRQENWSDFCAFLDSLGYKGYNIRNKNFYSFRSSSWIAEDSMCFYEK